MLKRICNIYRSEKKEGMYLYTDKMAELSAVPESLLHLFGRVNCVASMLITEDKMLARVSAIDVLNQLETTGYYLQMPLAEDSEMTAIAEKNSKLLRS